MTREPVAIIAQRYPQIVTPVIEQARHSIRVIVFDWRFYPTVEGSSVSKFNAAILAAAKRGVEVRALVNNDGVIARLASAGCKARRLHSKRMLHTKLLIVDDRLVVIGSHNYTQHGFALNEEASVMVEMPEPQNDFVRYFEALWGV